MSFSCKIRKTVAVCICAFTLNPAFAEDAAFEKAFQVVKEGFTTGDKATLDKGIKMLETAANQGSGESAFNLAVLYQLPQFADESKKCFWSMKAARLNYVNAYYSAAICEMKANKGGDKMTTLDKYAMPWIAKIAKEDTPEEQAKAQEILSEWAKAKQELAQNKGSGGAVRLGDLFSAFGIDSISAPSQPASSTSGSDNQKKFVCKIYCQSASGPITSYELTAKNRRAAANYVGDHADEICHSDGHSYASKKAFSENQCSEK